MDIKEITSCPDCGSTNIIHGTMRDQIICRDCGLIFEPLAPVVEEKMPLTKPKPKKHRKTKIKPKKKVKKKAKKKVKKKSVKKAKKKAKKKVKKKAKKKKKSGFKKFLKGLRKKK